MGEEVECGGMRYGWLLMLVLMSACSPAQEEGVPTAGGQVQSQDASAKPAADPAERGRQFVACMRAEGVDVPDPEPGDTSGKSALRFEDVNVDKPKFSAALEKCSVYLPQGGEPGRTSQERLEAARRLAVCMRENGVPAWPDPDAEGNFKAGGDGGPEIDKNDPAVRDALEKCRAAR